MIRKSLLPLTLALAFPGAAKADEALRSTVWRVANAPAVDGLEDAVYRESFPIEGFTYPGRMDPAAHQTVLRLVQDGVRLYGYARCEQPDVADLKESTPIRNGGNVWRGHALELMFWTNAGLRYFAFDPMGSIDWQKAHQDDAHNWQNDDPGKSDVRHAVRRDAKGRCWIVEFSIPLSELPGRKWRFNAIRGNPSDRTSCWQRQEECAFWAPNALFGELVCAEAPIGRLAFGRLPSFDPARPFFYSVTNAHQAVVYRYECFRPAPFVRIFPDNTEDGQLLVFGSCPLPTRIVWNCRHNYPEIPKGVCGQADVPVSVILKVPKGLTAPEAARTGTGRVEGVDVTVYEQRFRYVYKGAGWICSSLNATLPHGAEGKIWYAVRHEGGETPFRAIPFRVVDIPAARAPKRFMTGHYQNWPRTAQAARRLEHVGINTVDVRGQGDAKASLMGELAAAGFRIRRGSYFWPGVEDDPSTLR